MLVSNLAYRMTSIKRLMDLVKSETYKRKSYFFRTVRKLQKKFNTDLYGFDYFVIVLLMRKIEIPEFLIDFQTVLPKANVRESSDTNLKTFLLYIIWQ